MLFTFVLIVQTLVAAALVIVVLMQRSEGGGLGVGGNSSGLMSARGAADFLTRATSVLAVIFVSLSIFLAALAAVDRAPSEIDPNLARPSAPAPAGQVPVAGGAIPGAALPGADGAAPAEANGSVPLAQ